MADEETGEYVAYVVNADGYYLLEATTRKPLFRRGKTRLEIRCLDQARRTDG